MTKDKKGGEQVTKITDKNSTGSDIKESLELAKESPDSGTNSTTNNNKHDDSIKDSLTLGESQNKEVGLIQNIEYEKVIAQKLVKIEVKENDIMELEECVTTKATKFIEDFGVKNHITIEEAYSILLTQAIMGQHLSNKKMIELFEFIEPDLTIFNEHSGYSLFSALLEFGTRDDLLFLKQYVNEYEWDKVDLYKNDQDNIYTILSLGTNLQVTENEYMQFLTGLFNQIYSKESLSGRINDYINDHIS